MRVGQLDGERERERERMREGEREKLPEGGVLLKQELTSAKLRHREVTSRSLHCQGHQQAQEEKKA